MATAAPKIKLYTNHLCPWAHRAHIALAELDIPYEEEIIDLSKPRTPEYLQINPRGLVPTIDIGGTIIGESAVVSTLLADAFPSKLLPASTDPNGPLVRAKINFFVDTYMSKAHGEWFKILMAKSEDEEREAATAFVDAVAKHVEPLLGDAKPFFGGSSGITLAEVLTGSWLLRVYAMPKYGISPSDIPVQLAEKAPNFDRWAKAVIEHPSVRCIWDEEKVVETTKARLAKMKA